MKQLVILSGGLDSTVALYKMISIGNEVEALSFNYGSRHNFEELEKAKKTCLLLGIKHMIVDLRLDLILKSALLEKSDNDIPHGQYSLESLKKTVVPFRNGIMLSIAAAIAESNDFDQVVLGNHLNDNAVYPDCRPTFIESMSEAISYGTFKNIKIHSPFMLMNKRDIGLIGSKLGVDFRGTYSCYKGGKIHCGECSTCNDRKIALSGFDNTEYMK